MSTDWKPIWSKARAWHAEGHKVGLATVIETWGSSPRPIGSHLILNGAGLMEGSVSGGCVEGAVIAALEAVMEGADPHVLDFSVTTEEAWQVGLSCGGRIRVFVENMEEKLVLSSAVLDAQAEKMLVTDISTGVTELRDVAGGQAASFLMDEDGKQYFYQLLSQPLKLMIVGAVHISQAMVKMASVLGVEAVVIDPRGAFAQDARFEGETLISDWPDEVLRDLEITTGTAVVTLTHDPKLDDAALAVALKSQAFYIASLGSRKTHAARVDRLLDKGFSKEEVARIHGPAGLNIGAKTPAEIALSVLSQMVSVYRQEQNL